MMPVPFKFEDFERMKLQPAQAYLSGYITEKRGAALEKLSSHGIAPAIDAQPIAFAGIIGQWEGRAVAWAFLSQMATREFMGVHRCVKTFLNNCGVRRVEMTVDCDFEPAHRWARALGFVMEAERMSGYAPDGHDCALYARVTP
jgi:hypothetical protein